MLPSLDVELHQSYAVLEVYYHTSVAAILYMARHYTEVAKRPKMYYSYN